MTPLKSGATGQGDWQHINKVAAKTQFGGNEVIAVQHAINARAPRQLRTPIGGSTGGNWNYRGVWLASPPSPYMTFDVVSYGSGTAGGMYLSTIDGNTNAPDTGLGWVQCLASSGPWL